ncbi:MAG: hypothetical protein JRG73_01830 [Deltaproteobacteria bacterium]|nr:hypothetical protein [Deltaproteobacteria bacterium]
MIRPKRIYLTALLAVSAFLIGYASISIADEKGSGGPKFDLKIAPEADVKASAYKKEWKGKSRLHVQLEITNVTDKPQRFKVMGDIPEGPAFAMKVPRKGKPPVVKPKETQKVVFPLIYEKMPDRIFIELITVSAQ